MLMLVFAGVGALACTSLTGGLRSGLYCFAVMALCGIFVAPRLRHGTLVPETPIAEVTVPQSPPPPPLRRRHLAGNMFRWRAQASRAGCRCKSNCLSQAVLAVEQADLKLVASSLEDVITFCEFVGDAFPNLAFLLKLTPFFLRDRSFSGIAHTLAVATVANSSLTSVARHIVAVFVALLPAREQASFREHAQSALDGFKALGDILVNVTEVPDAPVLFVLVSSLVVSVLGDHTRIDPRWLGKYAADFKSKELTSYAGLAAAFVAFATRIVDGSIFTPGYWSRGDPATDFYTRVQDVITAELPRNTRNELLARRDTRTKCIEQFREEITELRAIGVQLRANASIRDKLRYTAAISTLDSKLASTVGVESTFSRLPAIVWYIWGGSGVGKTRLSDLVQGLVSYHSQKGQEKRTRLAVGTLDPASKWADGVKSDPPIWFMDEVGSKELPTDGGAIQYVLQACTSKPVSVPLSQTEYKDKLLSPSHIVMTSNAGPDVIARNLKLHYPEAFHRRVIYMKASVKPEFATPAGRPDRVKIGRTTPWIWDVRVYLRHPDGDKPLAQVGSYDELCAIMGEIMDEHLAANLPGLMNDKFCDVCCQDLSAPPIDNCHEMAPLPVLEAGVPQGFQFAALFYLCVSMLSLQSALAYGCYTCWFGCQSFVANYGNPIRITGELMDWYRATKGKVVGAQLVFNQGVKLAGVAAGLLGCYKLYRVLRSLRRRNAVDQGTTPSLMVSGSLGLSQGPVLESVGGVQWNGSTVQSHPNVRLVRGSTSEHKLERLHDTIVWKLVGVGTAHALSIGRGLLVVAGHNIDSCSDVLITRKLQGFVQQHSESLSAERVWHHPSKDLAIVKISNPMEMDVIDLLDVGKHDDVWYVSGGDRKNSPFCAEVGIRIEGGKQWNGLLEYPRNGEGLCGLPVFRGDRIVGIHTHGYPDGRAGLYTPFDLLFMQKVEEMMNASKLPVELDYSLIDLHPRSTVQRLAVENSFPIVEVATAGRPIGTLPDIHIERDRSSEYQRSVFEPPDRWTYPGEPPPLSRQRFPVWYDPYESWLKNLEAVHSPNVDLYSSLLREYLFSRFGSDPGVKVMDLSARTPVTMTEAINGNAYLKALNFTTSGGIGYPGAKLSYFYDGLDGERVPIDRLERDVDKVLTSWSRGELVRPLFKAFAKDEPRKKKEARMICGSRLDVVIACRMLLLPFLTLMFNNPEVFRCAIGINCFSPAWEKMYDSINGRKLEKLVGDFKNFDFSQCFAITRATADVIIDVCRHVLRYPEPWLKMIDTMYDDIGNPVVVYGADVVDTRRNMASGRPETGPFNSLVNLGVHLYASYQKCQDRQKVFRDMKGWFFGDDSIVTTRGNWLTQKDVAKFSRDLGFVYTDAAKKTEMSDFALPEEVTFLKRYFKHHDDLGVMVAPIEEISVQKMLTWTRRGKKADPVQVDEQIARCVQLEAALWGRERFDALKAEVPKLDAVYSLSYEQALDFYRVGRYLELISA